jgi:phenylacetate-CoA ligase
MNLNQSIFILRRTLSDHRFYHTYKQLMNNLARPYGDLLKEQDICLQKMIQYCYRFIPFYRKYFQLASINPNNSFTRNDLIKLPILSKETIRENYSQFTPTNLEEQRYLKSFTSGSTGTPLSYRISKYDRMLGTCILYRGWSQAGYHLGDKMIYFGGSSLGAAMKKPVIHLINQYLNKTKILSSFNLNSQNIGKYLEIINRYHTEFIRGYASSITFISKWITQNNYEVNSPKAIFTTAEKLYPDMRDIIQNAFHCSVFDTYGLNDGGVSAYEVSDHTGLRIDTERSVLEVVDSSGLQILNGTGRIIATSLHNKALPFIRYDTGDIGEIAINQKGEHILKNIVGRKNEILQTPEGENIHGAFFTTVFKRIDNINRFQVVQESISNITIYIVPDRNFDQGQIEIIRHLINLKSPKWHVKIKITNQIKTEKAGKYQYIISKINNNG